MTPGPPSNVRIQSTGKVRLRISGPEDAARSVLCFPCAGGTSVGFKPLASALPSTWRVAAVDPPGHGFDTRPSIDRVEDLIAFYEDALEAELARRPILCGHSLGGLISYLLALGLESRGQPSAGVILCASRAPGHIMFERWSFLSDDQLLERLDAIGGIPEPLRDDKSALLAYLPAVRADFRALEHWYIGRSVPPLSCRLLIGAATEDTYVPASRMQEWTAYSQSSEFKLFTGGHFFVQRRPDMLAEWMERVFG